MSLGFPFLILKYKMDIYIIVPKGCRTNVLTRSKGLAAKAAKTECTKITVGN